LTLSPSLAFAEQLTIKEGRTELIVPHNGKNLSFLHPAYGPDTYANVKSQIEQAGLTPPTMGQIASLVHSAFDSNDRYSGEIKNIMKNRWLWAYTQSNYQPKPIDGVFVYDEKDENTFKDLSGSELEKMLGNRQEHGVVYSDNGLLRFVPFGYQVGEMIPLKLAKNPYVIALAGEEAEKLAEVADKHKDKPYLWSFKSVDQPLTRVSILVSDWGLGHGLGVDGSSHGNVRGGHGFGVLKETGEAGREKK